MPRAPELDGVFGRQERHEKDLFFYFDCVLFRSAIGMDDFLTLSRRCLDET